MTRTEIPKSILMLVFVKLFAIGLVFSSAIPALASTGTTFEEAISPQFSYVEDVQQTSDGGYVVGANFCSSTCYIALVVKLDSSGNIQWQKQYQSQGGSSQLYAIRQTTDGGYVVAGLTLPSQFGIVQAWIEKLDSSGNVQWQKALGSSNSALANSVLQTTDGGYALAGFSGAPPNVLVAKFDPSGNVKWQALYSTSGSQGIGHSIVQTSDGGYMVGGYSYVSLQNALALKLSSGGKVQWAKTYVVSGATGQFNSVRQTSDGGYAFSGYFYTGGYNGGYNAWIVRTDSNGNVQWQKTYGNATAARQFQKIGVTGDGGFVAAGWTLQFNNQLEGYFVKTDSAGNVNNCNDVQSTAAVTASASLASSSAHLSIRAPTNGAVPGLATASSTSFTLTT